MSSGTSVWHLATVTRIAQLTEGRLMLLRKNISNTMMIDVMPNRLTMAKALSHPSPKISLT